MSSDGAISPSHEEGLGVVYVAFDSTAGSASKPNEDYAAASPTVVIMLDGLTAPPALGTGCTHGTPWFVRQLGTELLRAATIQPEEALKELLAGSISQVAEVHGRICDLGDPGTPASSVAMLREGDQGLDYLVLFDSVIVLDGPSGVEVLSDRRVDAVAQEEELATRAHPIGSLAHRARVDELIQAQRRHRNQPGGYWVAGAKPTAAYQAVTGSVPRSLVSRAALLTDGASCAVERYALGDWRWLLAFLEHHGPRQLIARVRKAEGTDPDGARWPRYKRSDDATAAFCIPG